MIEEAEKMEKKRYTLAIMVDNESGVLSRVSSLFSRKGYNIESIAAGTLETPDEPASPLRFSQRTTTRSTCSATR